MNTHELAKQNSFLKVKKGKNCTMCGARPTFRNKEFGKKSVQRNYFALL